MNPVTMNSNAYMLLNKSAQSNLGRGPRGGAVTHIGLRRKVPIGYNGAPQICPQNKRPKVLLPVD